MNDYPAPTGPPLTLSQRLQHLKADLQGLGERLKHSIASVIGKAIADAVRDAVRWLLGGQEEPTAHYPGNLHDPWDDPGERHWGHPGEERDWPEDHAFFSPRAEETAHDRASNETARRWRNAWTAGLQTALWWLARQSCRCPVLTTVAVGLAAGVTGYVAGPAVAAGVRVLASVASLLLTADASRSAAQILSG
jgi:hypothetical protein